MYSIITLFLLIMLDGKVIKIQLDQNQNKIWKQMSLAVPSQPFIHIIGHFALPGGEGITLLQNDANSWLHWNQMVNVLEIWELLCISKCDSRGHHHTIGGGQWLASIWRWQGRCSQQWRSVKLRAVSTWRHLLPCPPLPLLCSPSAPAAPLSSFFSLCFCCFSSAASSFLCFPLCLSSHNRHSFNISWLDVNWRHLYQLNFSLPWNWEKVAWCLIKLNFDNFVIKQVEHQGSWDRRFNSSTSFWISDRWETFEDPDVLVKDMSTHLCLGSVYRVSVGLVCIWALWY